MTQPPSARRARLTLSGLLEVISYGALFATAGGFLGRVWWMFELASHFRFHLGVTLGVVSGVWLIRRRWRLAVVCALFAGTNAILVLSLLWPRATGGSVGGQTLRLAMINVHSSNRRSDAVLEFLRSSDADVVLLMEINERWISELEPLRVTHPHCVVTPRDDDFGIALFSRLPLMNGNVTELGDAQVPSIEAVIVRGDQEFHLLGTHPLPPGSAEYARLRNGQYRAIAAYARSQNCPTVVAGDLNATPWSPHFADLLRDSGLQNSSQGRGVFGSWPAWLPAGKIPLNHCLVSPTIRVVSKRLGSPIGSDHLPVVVDLQVPHRDAGVAQP